MTNGDSQKVNLKKRGLAESKIIIRFWLVSWLLAMAGLAMLKLR